MWKAESSVDKEFESILKTEYSCNFDSRRRDALPDDLKDSYNNEFDDKRKKAMVTSYYKYGKLSENANNEAYDFFESLKLRLQKAKETKNTEFLVDIANFCMMMCMYHSREWVTNKLHTPMSNNNYLEHLEFCIEAAERTKNLEYLVDASNCCMLLFSNPPKGWTYTSTDSEDSCGIVGYSINEIRNFDK